MEIKEKIAQLLDALGHAESSAEILQLSRELHELAAVLVHQEKQVAPPVEPAPAVDQDLYAKISTPEPAIPATPDIQEPVAMAKPEPEPEVVAPESIPVVEPELAKEIPGAQEVAEMVAKDSANLDASPSLNDMLSDKVPESTLADRLGERSFASIKSMIDLNAKIGFANELFSGNMDTFNQVVGQLDAVASKADALGVLANYNLPNESEMSEQLVQLLDRKFA